MTYRHGLTPWPLTIPGGFAASGWDSLTGTELKVAAFVEEGLTNRAIAARLMVPPRTVSTHVSHILAKLGACSRTEIARESALRAGDGS